MRREFFVLAAESAAVAYLFYYVLASGGDFFARLSVGVLSIIVIAEWSLFFYKLGLKS